MKYILKPISVVLLLTVIMACTNSGAQQSKEKELTGKPTYDVIEVKKDTLHYALNLPGELNPYEQVTLYARVEGFIRELNVDRGDQVKKGQVLAVIEAPEIEQDFLAAQSKQREIMEKLSFSHENYHYLKNAAETEGAVSQVELERAKAQFIGDSASLEAAKAEVMAAEQLAKYRVITAPFDAVVTDRLVSPGALVGGGKEALYKLSSQNKLRLEVAIPAKHQGVLNKNLQASFKINSSPGESFPVQFSRSSQALNKELRSIIVEFDTDNSDQLFKAGDYADVHLEVKRNRPTIQVPTSSIINTQSGSFVARVTDGVIAVVPIITGISHKDKVEIFGEIEEGDHIIEKANPSLKDGMEVEAYLDEKFKEEYILRKTIHIDTATEGIC